jgi:excisionase family DNA binding protein
MTTSRDGAAGTNSTSASSRTPPGGVTGSNRSPAESFDGLAEVRFLTVAEVAAVMRVSKMTVYRLVHGGELPAVRVGRSFRVPEKAVHDYLRAAFIEAG